MSDYRSHRHPWQRFSSSVAGEPKVLPTPLRYATAPFWMPFTLLGAIPYFAVMMVIGFFWDAKNAPRGTITDLALSSYLPVPIGAPVALGVLAKAREVMPPQPDSHEKIPKKYPFWLIGGAVFWGLITICAILVLCLFAM